MPDLQLVLDLVVAVAAAFAGGLVAQRLGQPVILGYIVAGVLIGPFTPGPRADVDSIRILAEIGVAFLMFALGAEVSRRELRVLGHAVSRGGPLQILLTMAVGPLIAPLFGITLLQGLFLGAVLVHSSSTVALKVFQARGEGSSLHGRLSLGISIAQDLSLVPMIILLPPLVVGGPAPFDELLLATGKAIAVVLAAYVVGTRALPWLLEHAAVPRSREVFLLGVVAFALGTALLTEGVGLSIAFGAFVAGLVVSESEYRTQVVAEVLPLRDLFTSLFFVSIGMLLDPLTILREAWLVGVLLAIVVVGKFAIIVAIVAVLGMPGRVAVLTGLGLAQIGEIAFVLARVGADTGALPGEVFDLTLATAALSIILVPFLLRATPLVLAVLQRLPVVGGRFAEPLEEDPAAAGLRRHVVICGFGRLGRELADALEARGLRYLVVEYNPEVARDLRSREVPVIYGDAANPAVLEHSHLDHASLLAVLMPDGNAAERCTRIARQMEPDLDIIARASGSRQIERLRAAGATDVVQPEFEAGVEVIRHALRRYGISGQELANIAAGRRRSFYRHRPEDDTRE